ncbi:hypothetical protein IBE97_03690 [Francisella tularensis]|uniref:50S rRNA methyltransferase n=1 Tax=Francisella tularensis subsp. holarctica TaxID=119857 RepID=A0A6B2JQZ3_FRATU|nr:hypothetical protein [Francisella tularensis]MBC2780571.1 hypothetical protein [Francisella tularensis subsp. holarctica]MBC2782251.1 hypothetical protein [Francisella tularensis subsp. holarctica]MBC2783728.1 hypothetical protein [Francisella tularensis subsp. holarctica]MBC2785307.1 hypothetical protein [Francisella tularensis subsp. holarctica]MBC2786949.1 hypothetical protein [Francisella tularensis subsp. holarctica]
MMAFLLDIITFLQISFSTNIFRINYKCTSIQTRGASIPSCARLFRTARDMLFFLS